MQKRHVPVIPPRIFGTDAAPRMGVGPGKPTRRSRPAIAAGVQLGAGTVGSARCRGTPLYLCRQLKWSITTHKGDVAQGEVVVKDSRPAADGRGSPAQGVPGKAQPGLQVGVMLLEDFGGKAPLHTVVAQLLVDRVEIGGR